MESTRGPTYPRANRSTQAFVRLSFKTVSCLDPDPGEVLHTQENLRMTTWTDAQIKKAMKILQRHPVSQFREAIEAISKATGREVTRHALRNVFDRHGLGAPTTYLREEEGEDEEATEERTSSEPSEMAQKLYGLVKKGPVPFQTLCDKLDLSPSKTQTLIEEARKSGLLIHTEHNHVAFKSKAPDDRIKPVGIAPVVGVRQKVAVISDTHLGSKYCLREQLKDFVHYAYAQGVREILHPGDVLDGIYKHGLFEVSHTGIDAQTQDLFETLPQLPGLTYHAITGNHDFTFTEAVGVSVGEYITNYFRERGRNDIKFYGDRGAFLKIRGAVVHLWHPRSGGAYAKSYGIQKQVEKYSSIKPQILLTGHWHIYCNIYERGVHAIACPTFQGGGSAYGKSLGGAPAIGGLLLSWDLTEHGTIRSFVVEKRSYFEEEKPVQINNPIDAIKVR